MKNEVPERVPWIDVARGIGILLIMYGHTLVKVDALAVFIYSFHVPLFFFISGYLFNEKAYPDLTSYAKRKWRSLLVPYVVFFSLSVIFSFIALHVYFTGEFDSYIFTLNTFKSFAFSSEKWMSRFNNAALWFLPCLFVTGCYMVILLKVCPTNLRVMGGLLLMLSVVAYGEAKYIQGELPWGIDIAFIAVVFYAAGFISRKTGLLNSNWTAKRVIVASAAITALCVNIYFGQANGLVGMAGRQMGRYFYYYLAAFSGIIFCLLIARLAGRSKSLAFFGRTSLIFLGIHLLVFKVVAKLVEVIFHGVSGPTPEYLIPAYAYEILLFMLTVFFTLPFVLLALKMFPSLRTVSDRT